jgi:hypothetical protein
LSESDIRLTRLAVTLCRDRSWLNLRLRLRRLVRDALLYVGVEPSVADTAIRRDFTDSTQLTKLFDYLDDNGLMPEFLTQMLRDYHPQPPFDQQALVEHLAPLGLEWVKVPNQVRPTSTSPEAERKIRGELGDLLAEVDSAFPTMLGGAWGAYYSDNPDRYRQAITSCRELLTQVTDRLGGEGTRRERIHRIINSKSTVEIVDASANLVNTIYNAQSAGTHSGINSATALFVLVETEHILYFLLKQGRIKRGN